MMLLSKFYVMIISYVFIKNFILYINNFKRIGLFISIFTAIILLEVHIYAKLPVRVAYLFFADTCMRSVPIFYIGYIFYIII